MMRSRPQCRRKWIGARCVAKQLEKTYVGFLSEREREALVGSTAGEVGTCSPAKTWCSTGCKIHAIRLHAKSGQ